MITFMEYVQLIESDEPSRRDILKYLSTAGGTALTGGGLAYLANSMLSKKNKKTASTTVTQDQEKPQANTPVAPQDSGSVTKPGIGKGQGKDYGHPDKITITHVIEAKGELLSALADSKKTPAKFRDQVNEYLNRVYEEQEKHWKSVGLVRGMFIDREWLGPRGKKYSKKQWERNDYEDNIIIMYTRVAEMMIENFSGSTNRFDSSGAYRWVEEVLWPIVQKSGIDVWPIIGLADKRLKPPARVK